MASSRTARLQDLELADLIGRLDRVVCAVIVVVASAHLGSSLAGLEPMLGDLGLQRVDIEAGVVRPQILLRKRTT